MACMVCSMMTMVMPSLRQRADEPISSSASCRPRPAERLVEQQEPGLAGKRARQLHQPQLAVVSAAARAHSGREADTGHRVARKAARLGVRGRAT